MWGEGAFRNPLILVTGGDSLEMTCHIGHLKLDIELLQLNWGRAYGEYSDKYTLDMA